MNQILGDGRLEGAIDKITGIGSAPRRSASAGRACIWLWRHNRRSAGDTAQTSRGLGAGRREIGAWRMANGQGKDAARYLNATTKTAARASPAKREFDSL